jgi:excisionase family DNA binding protein
VSQLLEAADVATLLGMTKDWVYAEVRAGRIPHVRLGRYVRFRSESIDAWLLESERGKIGKTT